MGNYSVNNNDEAPADPEINRGFRGLACCHQPPMIMTLTGGIHDVKVSQME